MEKYFLKKIYEVICCIIFFTAGFLFICIEKACSLQLETEWGKTLGSGCGIYVQPTDDGGYITMSPVVKTDSSGNMQWEKKLGTSIVNNMRMNYVEQTPDGGYIAVGEGSNIEYNEGYEDVYIVKFDALCNVQWEKKYGAKGDINDDGYIEYNVDGGQAIEETDDGGYIILGYTYQYGYPYLAYPVILKLDGNGNLLWNKVFVLSQYWGPWGPYYNRTRIIKTIDGGYCFVGSVDSATNSYHDDICLFKIDASGNKQWERTYGLSTRNDTSGSVQQTSDGGYIILGSTVSYGAGKNDIYLLKLDSNGIKQWDKTFGGQDEDCGYSFQSTSDGGYIILGLKKYFTDTSDAFYLVKVDNLGNLQWDGIFGTSLDTSQNYAGDVKQTRGGYIVTGELDGKLSLWKIKSPIGGTVAGNIFFEGLPSGKFGNVTVLIKDSSGQTVATSTYSDWTYNLSNIPYGYYTVSFCAPKYLNKKVTDGTSLANIKLIVGDIDGDNVINLTDLVKLAKGYNSKKDINSNYEFYYDLNDDGVVNLTDLVLLAKNYNKIGD